MTLMKVIDMQELRQRHEDPLNLASLPMVAPEEDGWPAIEAALLERNRRHKVFRLAGGALATAATVVLAIAVTVGRPVPEPAAGLPDPDSQAAISELESAPLRPPALESLIAMSQQLEGRVRLYRDEFGDLPSSALIYQVELQDLIVQVDEELSANPESIELWGQRVNLLLDVTQLYENSLRREYRQMASL